MKTARFFAAVFVSFLLIGCEGRVRLETNARSNSVESCTQAEVPTLYFGHPVGTYNTELEKQLIAKIESHFPGWRVENPNQPHHQKGYADWREKTGNGMDYFFKDVIPRMQGGVFLPYRDGKWGAGVYGEAVKVFERGCPVWGITHEGVVSKTTPEEMRLMGGVLNIEETRQRNKLPY